MPDVMQILRDRFPGRESFTDAEVEFASSLLCDAPSPEKSRITPITKYVPVGDVLVRYGRSLRCVARPHRGLACVPGDACNGCFFSLAGRYCDDIQCSSWDRRDGRNVWFQEEAR